ncbi:NADPH-dependent pterin aldehyde reductase [Vitis vinifera]|uniref:NADPH-dependent pterin aldehyde reductase n=1 Tax=Vitis vinifera TaxID=29760 RepID=A0A438JA54_VITVI|nr:NADPH-dependent pterin aldehyde reductase [Vitis vinifera]
MTTSFGGMNIVNRAAAATAGGAGGGNRTVLITGVGKGLGRALALEIAKRGHTVVGCSRSQDRLTSLQSELSSVASSPQSDSAVSSSDRHFFMTVDVRSNSSVEELARAVMEKKGVPDIIGT